MQNQSYLIILIANRREWRVSLGKQTNNLAQRQQRLVDARALFEPTIARRIRGRHRRRVGGRGRGRGADVGPECVVDPLGAGQIDQVDFTRDELKQRARLRLLVRRLLVLEHLSQRDLKDRMRSRRLLIHVGASGGATLVANVEPYFGVGGRLSRQSEQVDYVGPGGWVLANLERFGRGAVHCSHVLAVRCGRRRRAQEIVDLLVVDLVVADLAVHLGDDLVAYEFAFEQVVDETRNETGLLLRADHRVGFARACLAIREYGHIVAVECLAQQRLAQTFVHVLLLT